jgi:hypothetical protein
MKRAVLGFAAMLLIASAPAPQTDGQDRREVIDAVAGLLEERYVDAELGRQLAIGLRESGNEWDNVRSGPEFAEALTQWLRLRSQDGHLALDYVEQPLSNEGGTEEFSEREIERYYGAHLNHGVQKIERLDGNIMLVDLRVFPPQELAGEVISAMMTVAAQGDALILDLRNNGGGMETVDLITGYLLPPGSPLSGVFDRPSEKVTTRQSPVSVPGRRFGETKPLYILTSRRTFSAAEALAYDLQALKRATIVGEVTGGGANPFEYRRVHAHFALSLPEQRSINPLTGTNWQGVGVQPDVEVPAGEALQKAIALAKASLQRGR